MRIRAVLRYCGLHTGPPCKSKTCSNVAFGSLHHAGLSSACLQNPTGCRKPKQNPCCTLLTIPRCWPGRPAHLSKSIDAIEIAWNKPCDRGLVPAFRSVGVRSLRFNVGRICFCDGEQEYPYAETIKLLIFFCEQRWGETVSHHGRVEGCIAFRDLLQIY